MTGILGPDDMEHQFDLATLALVSQRGGVPEFNMPSKLMNFMAQGLPVLALAKPGSELERVVLDSGCGWVMDNSKLELFGETVAAILADREELARRALAGRDFARAHFTADAIAAKFEAILAEI
jgi:colanic acid biosynthesis glycosyl transferase WcaI